MLWRQVDGDVERIPAGWWRVRRGAEEGWAPHNYLELIPPKPKPVAPPPPPARRAPPAAPKPASESNGAPRSPPVAAKPAAPPVAAKPKPTVPAAGAKPPLAPKPGAGGKPPVPTAARPVPAPAPKPAGGSKIGGAAPGQMDLAAAVSFNPVAVFRGC